MTTFFEISEDEDLNVSNSIEIASKFISKYSEKKQRNESSYSWCWKNWN